MLKNFKGLITKTCLEEFAHRFLIAVFDTVDDTVLINRYLLKVDLLLILFFPVFLCFNRIRKSGGAERRM